jgi:hypothetical protein
MKMNNRQNWDEDDFEIHEEFEDLSSTLDAIKSFAPRVPRRLDRRIRDLANYQSASELSNNWIFSRAPQLALAAILLFGIGVYFVLGLERTSEATPVPGSKVNSMSPSVNEQSTDDPVKPVEFQIIKTVPVTSRPGSQDVVDKSALDQQGGITDVIGGSDTELTAESIHFSSGYSWVKLRFNVDDSGEVREIIVIESCLKNAPRDHCIDDDVHDSYAIEQVKRNTYPESGESEEMIIIPPEYVAPKQL